MAYGNYLASVSPEQVRLFREGATHKLSPSKLVMVTHLCGYWVKHQPLGALLGEAIDGGSPVNAELWHPLRAPIYHPPDAIAVLFRDIAAAWQNALAGEPFRELEWFRKDIEDLLAIFEWAVNANEGVVSALEPPFDVDEASRVTIPFDVVLTETQQ